MEILEFFERNEASRKFWAAQIAEGDWRAAKYLAELLDQGTFQNRYGPDGRIFLLTEADALVSFCTFVRQDEIADDSLTPWIGFVYTFPTYRGNRYSQRLIDHVCAFAKARGCQQVYLSSDEQGLYEKYGFHPLQSMKTLGAEMTQVYVRSLSAPLFSEN